jgi:hypothetical protein
MAAYSAVPPAAATPSEPLKAKQPKSFPRVPARLDRAAVANLIRCPPRAEKVPAALPRHCPPRLAQATVPPGAPTGCRGLCPPPGSCPRPVPQGRRRYAKRRAAVPWATQEAVRVPKSLRGFFNELKLKSGEKSAAGARPVSTEHHVSHHCREPRGENRGIFSGWLFGPSDARQMRGQHL